MFQTAVWAGFIPQRKKRFWKQPSPSVSHSCIWFHLDNSWHSASSLSSWPFCLEEMRRLYHTPPIPDRSSMKTVAQQNPFNQDKIVLDHGTCLYTSFWILRSPASFPVDGHSTLTCSHHSSCHQVETGCAGMKDSNLKTLLDVPHLCQAHSWVAFSVFLNCAYSRKDKFLHSVEKYIFCTSVNMIGEKRKERNAGKEEKGEVLPSGRQGFPIFLWFMGGHPCSYEI